MQRRSTTNSTTRKSTKRKFSGSCSAIQTTTTTTTIEEPLLWEVWQMIFRIYFRLKNIVQPYDFTWTSILNAARVEHLKKMIGFSIIQYEWNLIRMVLSYEKGLVNKIKFGLTNKKLFKWYQTLDFKILESENDTARNWMIQKGLIPVNTGIVLK